MLSMVRRPLSAAVPAGNLLGIHLFQCPDTVGIVAKLSECIASHGGNIHSVDVFVPDDKRVFYSRSFPVNSRTTQGSGHVTSCTRISSTFHTASVRRDRPYECLILTPNTRSQSSLQSRTIVCLIYCIDGKKAGFQLTLIVS
jgi:formyltetrahydrofolate hydrolase